MHACIIVSEGSCASIDLVQTERFVYTYALQSIGDQLECARDCAVDHEGWQSLVVTSDQYWNDGGKHIDTAKRIVNAWNRLGEDCPDEVYEAILKRSAAGNPCVIWITELKPFCGMALDNPNMHAAAWTDIPPPPID